MPRLTETRARRAPQPASGQTFEWCSEIKGFGVRLTAGARSYIVQLRYRGDKMRLTLGPVGTLPFEGPADDPGAKDLALAALNAARRGEDPRAAMARRKPVEVDAGPTLNDIWDAYERAGFPLTDGTGRKRPSTIKADRSRYRRHFRNEIGRTAAAAIDTVAARQWLDRIDAPGARNHALLLLKVLLGFAASRGLAATQAIAIKAVAARQVQNFYSPAELARLDAAMVALAAEKPAQLLNFSALRLLLATGARKGEVLGLRWADIDLDAGLLRLERDKTSANRRDILLTPTAVAVLRSLPRIASSPFVFPARAGHLKYIDLHFIAAIERAGLRKVRIHDLRHSFASAAVGEGVSLYTVGKLLGHRKATTTARYAHLEVDALRGALDRVAAAMAKATPQ